ncbi:MAG: M56 family metallopeptidase [Bacteroidota bacterium]
MNYLTEHTWMQALGWTLLHSLWQASLIALIWAITRQFLKRSSAQKRYLAAMGALFTLLTCSLLTFWQLLPEQIEAVGSFSADTQPVVFPTLEEIPANLFSLETKESWTDFFDILAPWLSLLWILGAAIMGIRFSGGLWYVHQLRHTANTPLDAHWQKRADAIAKRLGIKRAWQLMESELVSQPLTLGHFKPLVLIPVGMLSGLSPEQVEAILVHEFAHIRRADFLFNLIQSLIEILFFYHPAIWWLSREIRKERELCCDDLAVETLGDAFTYAEALTRLQLFRHSPQHFLTMQAKGKSGSFTARIHRLFAPSPSGPSVWKSFSAAVLLSIAVFGSGYYAYTQSNDYNANLSETILEDIEEGELRLFDASANIEELHSLIADLKDTYGIELEVLGTEKDKNGNFSKISLSYFDQERQIRRGYRAENFSGLFFEINPARVNPLQLGFKGKENEKSQGAIFELEAETEDVIGPPIHEHVFLEKAQDIPTNSIIAEYLIRPESSDFAFEEIKKDLSAYSPNQFFIKRGEEGRIKEFFYIYQYEKKFLKTGFKNFEQLKIVIKKEEGDKPKVHLLDDKGIAFWTDEIETYELSLFQNAEKENLLDWVKMLNQKEIPLNIHHTIREEDYLKRAVLSLGKQKISAIIPCKIQIIKEEDGSIISLASMSIQEEKEEDIMNHPSLVYVDGKNLGLFKVHFNDIPNTLIRAGYFMSQEDIARSDVLLSGTDRLEAWLEKQKLPPLSAKQLGIEKDFHVYALYSSAYMAKLKADEGKKKNHILAYYNGQFMGAYEEELENIESILTKELIKTGKIEDVKELSQSTRTSASTNDISEVLKDQKLPLPPFKIEKSTENELHHIFFMHSREYLLKNLSKKKQTEEEQKTQKGLIEIKGEISIDNSKELPNFQANKVQINSPLTSLSPTDENYYFFDGQPLGYRKGPIFEIIAAELKTRNLARIGGIVICDAEELNGKTYKTVQILSEEYEEIYYQRVERENPLNLNLLDKGLKPEIWLDREEIAGESLKQLNPDAIAYIDVFKAEAAQEFSGNPASQYIIHMTSKGKAKREEKPTPKAKSSPAPKATLALKVSPNPSTEAFEISFELAKKTEVRLDILDLQGKVIHPAIPLNLEAGSRKITWTPTDVPNGIYIAQLKTADGQVASQRLVLQR